MQVQNYININQAAEQLLNNPKTGSSTETTVNGLSFQDIFQAKAGATAAPEISLKFSKHAALRLQQREINLSTEQMERLSRGTDKAREKGIKDSLVLVDELAFIVNVPNKTVVTAMDKEQANENVFTNINGAVIM